MANAAWSVNMTNGTAPSPPLDNRTPEGAMTLRVYRVDPEGTVTQDTGKIIIPPAGHVDHFAVMPPCDCPRHHKAGASR